LRIVPQRFGCGDSMHKAGNRNTGLRQTRRRFVTHSVSAGALTLLGGIAKPYLSRAADRPQITHGIQSGDVSTDSGIVWARTDRPARMLVEASTSDRFTAIHAAAAIDALPESDFTAKALLENLPAGEDIFYRIRFEDLAFPTIVSEPQVGRFRTAPNDRRAVSFVWSGDTCGQSWASTRRTAACAPMQQCSPTGRTSSSIPATRSTPTAQSRAN
jgi:alkaline phosphatase D